MKLFGNVDASFVIEFDPAPAQRCYSFSCMNDHVYLAIWSETQEQALVTFYEDANCDGESFPGRDNTDIFHFGAYEGEMIINSPMMVLESGRYSTRGIVDICKEQERASQLNITMQGGNSSNSRNVTSSIGSADVSVAGDTQ